MTLPGDPNLPLGVTTRDTDGGGPGEHTCPKCGSREVSDLHAPDLWCSECSHEWDVRKPEGPDEPTSFISEVDPNALEP